jgi:hypothetical protein
MAHFEFDVQLLILWEPGPCCGTRRMIFIKKGSKRKTHGEEFVLVFKKTLKLLGC